MRQAAAASRTQRRFKVSFHRALAVAYVKSPQRKQKRQHTNTQTHKLPPPERLHSGWEITSAKINLAQAFAPANSFAGDVTASTRPFKTNSSVLVQPPLFEQWHVTEGYTLGSSDVFMRVTKEFVCSPVLNNSRKRVLVDTRWLFSYGRPCCPGNMFAELNHVSLIFFCAGRRLCLATTE